MLRIKHEGAQEEIKGIQVDNICEQLNAPIALQEVIAVLHNLRNGKAGGIDSLINEIFKYGGNEITVATWRLCEELQRKSSGLRRSPGTGHGVSSSHCLKKGYQGHG